jgi:outer membrane protein assembly factor BamB
MTNDESRMTQDDPARPRATVRVFSCVMPAALVVGLSSLAATRAEDWPSWRGPRGDGTWHAPKLPDRWPAGGPKRLWSRPIGGGFAGLSVVGDRLYTLDRDAKPGGTDSDGVERVVCLDTSDGNVVWQHAYPTKYGPLGGYNNGPRAAPTIHDGRVYTLGAVGHLHCLDATTGKLIWSHDLVREFQAVVPEWGFAGAPVIDGDRVIVHAGVPDGCYMAFDRQTGREIWRSLSDPAGYGTPILIDAPAGRQLVGWTPENVHGLDPATGERLWSVPYKVTYGVSIATPIYRDGLVFVTGYWEGSKAIRLGPGRKDATLAWEDTKTPRGLMAQPLYRDGHVYTVERTRGLVCTELATGKTLWDDHRLTPKARNPHSSMVWVNDGDRVLILNSAGELILARLSPQGYREDSRTKVIDGQVWGHPAFAGNRMYLRSDGAEQATRGGPFELIALALTD